MESQQRTAVDIITKEILLMKTFTKNDLKTGDFIILRNGLAGVVVAEKGAIIYQSCGYDEIDCMFNDDLTSLDGDDLFDIVRVYRAPWDGVISFSDFSYEGEIVFESPTADVPPQPTQRPQPPETPKRKLATILAQAFYGNRVITEVCADDDLLNLKNFISGNSSLVLQDGDIDLEFIPLAENVAVVYDKIAEAKKLKRDNLKKYKPFCKIPEKNIIIYSRCVLCRFKSENELESLKSGDIELVKDYFAW